MARIIKAPNVKQERAYRVVERDKVLRHADDEAAFILEKARDQEEEILRAAAQQADMIAADAEKQAEELRTQAKTEAEQAKEQAQEEGRQQGLNQGLQEARKQVADVVKDLKQMIAEARDILEGMIRDQEFEIRRLASEIVSRVIQDKLDADDEIVVRVARECIRLAADRQRLRVLVHPDDQKKVEEWTPEFTKMFDDIEKIEVQTDLRVKRGGVIIESGAGGVDGRIDKQLQILDETLLNP
ncbi:MAG: hypothetical protein JXR73_10160 [Candidatus Omnitrophica bacterium]|nr:hypothetical protein [Candidatus Omnitrophota bacterium]